MKVNHYSFKFVICMVAGRWMSTLIIHLISSLGTQALKNFQRKFARVLQLKIIDHLLTAWKWEFSVALVFLDRICKSWIHEDFWLKEYSNPTHFFTKITLIKFTTGIFRFDLFSVSDPVSIELNQFNTPINGKISLFSYLTAMKPSPAPLKLISGPPDW